MRETLTMLYGINHYAITANIAGVTNGESLVSPATGGNNMNWVLGHIIASRNGVLHALGQKPVWTKEEAAPYVRGSDGLRDASKARPFDQLVAEFNRSQELVMAGLKSISDADLAASVANQDIPKNVATLQFHEAYHAGQLGLLRRVVGKAGAIP